MTLLRNRLIYTAGAFVLFALAAINAHAGWVVPAEVPTPPASGATPTSLQRVSVGYVRGVLFISSLKSDVHLDCTSLVVEAREVGETQKLLSKVTAYGDITKACRYYLGAVPAGVSFHRTRVFITTDIPVRLRRLLSTPLRLLTGSGL